MEELQQALREAVASLERLPEEAKPEWRRALLFIYLLILHKRDASERSLLVETIEVGLEPGHQQEREEILMTGAQELILQGKKIGRQEGREEGRIAATQTVLLRLGSKRFGAPDEKTAAELTAITSIEQLEGLIERVLDVENWTELLSPE
jgi:hypothetical protein